MKVFERYQEYKPSGIDWIEEIPNHWQSIKLKYVASINPTTPVDVPDNIDLEFVPMENVDEKNGLIREYAYRPLDEIKTGYTPFQNNDVIFAKITPCMENGNCAIVQNLSNTIAFGSTEFIVLRSNELIRKELLYFILRNKNTRKIFEINMTGSAGQKRVPTPFVANYKIPLPPLKEQLSIANFLDQKSQQIDEFIADKQGLIALFEEQKKAIINDAVTKGLDKTVPLKPSGIEWIDEIPNHWEAKKLKYLVDFQNGYGFPDALQGNDSGDLPFCKVSDINGETKYIDTANNYVSFQEVMDNKWKPIQKNSILLAKIGEALKKNHRKINLVDCLIDNNMLAIQPTDCQLEFLYYTLLLIDMTDFSNPGAVPAINMDRLKNYKISIPQLEEQKQIVAYLETELAKIDTLIETAKAEITLIEEYKMSLINEAVTGKIKI